jgi:hypothetical protein
MPARTGPPHLDPQVAEEALRILYRRRASLREEEEPPPGALKAIETLIEEYERAQNLRNTP